MVNYKDRINEIIDKQDDIIISDLEVLDNCITTYPWFQAARSVYLKALKSESSPLYNKELQVVATHTADRSVLFDYITSIDFIQNIVSKQIQEQQEQLNNIEVNLEEVIAVEENLNQSMDHSKTLDQDLFKRESDIVKEPIEFRKEDDHSFSEWLKLTSLKPIERKDDLTIEQKVDNENISIIDKFLAEKPKITPRKTSSPIQNLADLNNPKPQLMTETLAQVYAAQKNYEKAIKAYEILKLQHPEKSGFFADRIREIKTLQSNS